MTSTLTTVATGAGQQLAAALSARLGTPADQLRAYGEQYGPRYAAVAAQIAIYKATGNQPGLDRCSADLVVLDDEVVEDLADAGILADAAAEQTARNVLTQVVGLVLSKLL